MSAATGYANQANYLVELKRYEQALAVGEKAIELDKTYWFGWCTYGFALGSLCKDPKCLSTLYNPPLLPLTEVSKEAPTMQR